eukprot:CAMPEP_0119516540 /NCGR_PEP_ID=MMETSP1344-20130328/33712_1 /TAXON_ID=236787 /ORGANISM="Florenciella parvula, Strain CCMP2471" /LENGTH=209 /DNA_ID=CAMNT_0007554049 /DNA_START=87 /DNA_END=712 /DNA_ORIENTATION=-
MFAMQPSPTPSSAAPPGAEIEVMSAGDTTINGFYKQRDTHDLRPRYYKLEPSGQFSQGADKAWIVANGDEWHMHKGSSKSLPSYSAKAFVINLAFKFVPPTAAMWAPNAGAVPGPILKHLPLPVKMGGPGGPGLLTPAGPAAVTIPASGAPATSPLPAAAPALGAAPTPAPMPKLGAIFGAAPTPAGSLGGLLGKVDFGRAPTAPTVPT